MAEKEEIFEHELSEKLKAFDAQIKIPEIPDAQTIFELAQQEKGKIIPFKKLSKFMAAAAAVVLICVAIPVMGTMVNGFSINNSAKAAETETAADSQIPYMADIEPNYDSTEKGAPAIPEDANESIFEAEVESPALSSEAVEIEEYNGFRCALERYFSTIESEKTETGRDYEDTDSVKTVNYSANKKRSINIEIESDSVAVTVFDTSAEDEIINAFWVEGIYQNSYFDENKGVYTVELTKVLTSEDLENDCYLPMLGDMEKGNYTISEQQIEFCQKVTKGEISIIIEIDLATGEYEIKATLI